MRSLNVWLWGCSWAAGRLVGWAAGRCASRAQVHDGIHPTAATARAGRARNRTRNGNERALGRLHTKAAYRSLIVNQPCIEQYRLYSLVEVRVPHAGPGTRAWRDPPRARAAARRAAARGGSDRATAKPVGASRPFRKYNDIRRYRKNGWIRARVDVRDPRTGSERSRQEPGDARDGWSATRRRCVVFEPRKRAAGRLTDPTRGETRDGSDLTDPSRCAEVPTYRYIAPRVLMLAGTVSATRDYEYAL